MILSNSRWTMAPAALLWLAPTLWSQVSPPDIGFVYPAGGRQGTTFEVKIAGRQLDETASIHVSGEGVEAKVLGQTRPLNQREIGALRKALQDLENKKEKTADDRKEIEELRKKLAPPPVRPTPALAEIVTVEMSINPKAEPGRRQLRIRAKTGMSNPVIFMVGQLPEITQKKELVDPEANARPKGPKAVVASIAPIVDVTLPVVLNSQIMPGTVDRYRFSARKGQQLVFIARARALIPYLADAVPGWFQAALTLFDSEGNEVAYSDHFHHQPDPVLAYKVEKDGDFVLEIKDALYRGREDFVYRIEAGELPFVTSIFPLGGKANTQTTVALEGWNLPETSLTLKAVDMKPGLQSLFVRKDNLMSNRVPFAVNMYPERMAGGNRTVGDTPPDVTSKSALPQPITFPTIINGCIAKPGAWDVFRFEGQKGEAIVAEVRARRLESPLDAVLKLTDSNGKVVAYNDDWEDKGQGLHTHHADSFIRLNLPASGTYYLHLGDAQGRGSPAHAYRLRVSAPQPDFELRVSPCSINARPGSTVPITVYAIRKDGFKGEIDLALTYKPVDFALSGAKVPADQDAVRLTLQVPTTIRPIPIDLVLEGRANINFRQVVRIATPAEDMMQAFIYHHLVPVNNLMVIVSGQARARFPAQILAKGPIKIRPGSTAQVYIAIPRAASAQKIQLLLNDPPEGITLKETTINKDGAILVLHADSDKVTPGFRGNLIVEAYPESTAKAGAGRMALGTLPAIPFEITRLGR